MIRNVINIDGYWKVIVYYNIDYDFFDIIVKDFNKYSISKSFIKRVYYNMFYKKAKAVTISVYDFKVSIVLFNKHKNYYDYINSIIHEAEHIKQSMLYVYDVEDYGEPPAYTVGYIASEMIKVFNLNIV